MEQTIEIKKANALSAWKGADQTGKKLLEDLLGKENVSMNIMERVKTFDDACNILGINPRLFYVNGDFSNDNGDIASVGAYARLIIIAKALNEGWKPDWEDDSQYKYFPWFKHKSGFGLSFVGCDGWRANATVGSRLCFKSKELAEYAAIQFADLYNQYLTIQ